MSKRPVVGEVLLIEHDGRPTMWPVNQTGDDDRAHLFEIFETAKKMCVYELSLEGRLKLIDVNGEVLAEASSAEG